MCVISWNGNFGATAVCRGEIWKHSLHVSLRNGQVVHKQAVFLTSTLCSRHEGGQFGHSWAVFSMSLSVQTQRWTCWPQLNGLSSQHCLYVPGRPQVSCFSDSTVHSRHKDGEVGLKRAVFLTSAICMFQTQNPGQGQVRL